MKYVYYYYNNPKTKENQVFLKVKHFLKVKQCYTNFSAKHLIQSFNIWVDQSN